MSMSKAKPIAILVLVVLAVVLVIQNTQSVPTKLLFWTVEWPHAVGFFVTTGLGFGLGMLTTLLRIPKSNLKAAK